MFLRRSLASLARAYKLHVYDFFFYVGTFGSLPPPPPPHTKKLATLLCQLSLTQKSGQMKMADSVPPPPLATRNRRHCSQCYHQGIDNLAKLIKAELLQKLHSYSKRKWLKSIRTVNNCRVANTVRERRNTSSVFRYSRCRKDSSWNQGKYTGCPFGKV